MHNSVTASVHANTKWWEKLVFSHDNLQSFCPARITTFCCVRCLTFGHCCVRGFLSYQAVTYDHILTGRDIIGKSRTGTGKTIAFGLPVIQHLGRFADDHKTRTQMRGRAPRFLVVCPTRELARQVEFFSGSTALLIVFAHSRAIDPRNTATLRSAYCSN